MGTKAHGRILFWEGASLWILSAPPGVRYPKTAVHAHHVTQVTLALTGRVDFEVDGVQLGGKAIAIAPDAAHAFQGTGLVAHLFIAPDGQEGRGIARALFAKRSMATLGPRELGDFHARLKATFDDPRHTDDDLCAVGRELISHLARESRAGGDARIAKLIPWVAARLDRPVSLGEVAELISLSPGRTRHLFVQQTGLPFRTWLLWRRLERATERFAAGASLTEAAHDAGFSDSAHLSRTFRRMFGIKAASLRLGPSPQPSPRSAGRGRQVSPASTLARSRR